MSNAEELRPASQQPSLEPSLEPCLEPPLAPSPAPIAQSEAVQPSSTLRRAVHALRAAVPYLPRLLPLLDGNIAAAVANVLAPQSAKPAPPVNLAPVEESITRLQTQNRELRDQLADQNLALKRLDQRLETVREATDRTALEHQELLAAFKKAGKKVTVVAFVTLALLILSVLLNLALVLHIERILH